MNLKEYMKNNILILDGAMGTMLQKRGLEIGRPPEEFNMTNPEAVKEVHTAYLQAGSKMILTNTFGANERKFRNYDTKKVILQAVSIAKSAAKEFDAFVALDIGPTGELFEPLGTLKFEDAYESFQKQVLIGKEAGVDAIYIETMTDLCEAKCAVLAAKENCDLPVFCTMSFESSMRTFTGVDISSMALTLQGLGVDYIGFNCSVGPTEVYKMTEELKKWTHLPIIVKPNAGLPSIVNGQTVFSVEPREFASEMSKIVSLGIASAGGCCGTTPEFIKELSKIAKDKKPIERKPLKISAICSGSKTVLIDCVRVIGERINPTGKKKLQTALLENDFDYIVSKAIEQIDAGADILDVNVGVPKIKESSVMVDVIREIQSVISTPLQIDSAKPEAIEAGLRAYTGKAIVNSVNGEDKSLKEILPIVKKYGAAVVGLTLDQNGIPKTAKERLEIARKIVDTASSYGIPKHDIFIDCLTLTSGAEQAIAYETLEAVRLVKEELGVKTVLGVSNISFGLPARKTLNHIFLTLAMANGLDMPIINPNEAEMMDAVFCYHQLKNIDKGSIKYIEHFQSVENAPVIAKAQTDYTIDYCILNGLKMEIKQVVKKLLEEKEPLFVVNHYLIPVLDVVGKKYEKGEIFLPQLLSSAEAAKSAFEIVKEKLPVSNAESRKKIILATVKGDIHDIGKNIVKVVLENYGYHVIDLGKDVGIERVVEEAIKHKVKLVGLSALMTTTLENMEKTIDALKKADDGILTMVGGAVLTETYAKKIGADFYGSDAIASVSIAREVFGK